jgi:hypothetical protein
MMIKQVYRGGPEDRARSRLTRYAGFSNCRAGVLCQLDPRASATRASPEVYLTLSQFDRTVVAVGFEQYIRTGRFLCALYI